MVTFIKRKNVAAPAVPTIKWGEECLPITDSYKYWGVMLHKNLTWDAHIEHVVEKAMNAAKSLYPILLNRGLSAEIKRMVVLTLIRPVVEHGAQVWNPHTKRDKDIINKIQTDIIKTAFHLPTHTSALLLEQELGMRPLCCWLDKRMLEGWHVLQHMAEKRLPKQIADMDWTALGAARGAATWQKKLTQTLNAYRIDAQAARDTVYAAFKNQVHEQTLANRRSALNVSGRARRDGRSGLVQEYVTRFGGEVQFARTKSYLHAGAATKGMELLMQLRMGSLQLRCLTGKYANNRIGDHAKFLCPTCNAAQESAEHFLLDCPHYSAERQQLMRDLAVTNLHEVQAFSALSASDQAAALMDDRFWVVAAALGTGTEAAADGGQPAMRAIAKFVARAWQLRCACLAELENLEGGEGLASQLEEDVEGAAAMAVTGIAIAPATPYGLRREVDGGNPVAD